MFGSITSKGYTLDPVKNKEVCLYNGDGNACNYGVGIGECVITLIYCDFEYNLIIVFLGVIAFLAASLLLAGEYFFPQMSSVKTRRHYVMGDAGFSGINKLFSKFQTSLC